MLFCQTLKLIDCGGRVMRFLAILSYMTFLVAIETFPQGEIVTDKVAWLLTVLKNGLLF